MQEITVCTSYRAGAYLRLSAEDRDIYPNVKTESNSIANQKALIQNEILKMPDVSLIEFYIDDGYTGMNFERPDFLRMLEDISSGRINMVIVKDLSRFGRDYIETGRYIRKKFPAMGIRFMAILDKYDSLTATPSDRNLLLPVKSFVNDNYSRDNSIRTRSHMAIMRKNGLYIGAYVAYGYLKSPEDKRKIIVDEYAAQIVVQIFDWFLSGMVIQEIANKLNDLGILAPAAYKRSLGIRYRNSQPTQSGKWSYVAVERILTNKMYLGYMIQGKTEKVNYKLKKIIPKPEAEQDIIEGGVPRIISDSKFSRIQRMRKYDLRVAPGQNTVYVLSGFLFCGECGKTMIRRVSNGKSRREYYICSSYNTKKECTRHSVRGEEINQILLTAINHQIDLIEKIEKTLETIEKMQIQPARLLVNDVDIQNKRKEIEKLENLMIKFQQSYGKQILSFEEYQEFKGIYEQKIMNLQNEIEEIQQEIVKHFQNGLAKNKWMEEFKKYKNLKKIDRLVLVYLVDRIVVHEDKRIEIQFLYQDEFKLLLRIQEDTEAFLSSKKNEVITDGKDSE
ncbi:MAG: recombinase family protein [Clostridiales bacterium]|nr:recombinase family protein [Clostridiales bacterium]